MLDLWKRLTLTAKITLLFTTLNVLIIVVCDALIVNLEISKELRRIDAELATTAKSYLRMIGEEKLDRAFTGGTPEEEYKSDKAAFTPEQSIEMIKNGSGTHFDPRLVDLFVGAI